MKSGKLAEKRKVQDTFSEQNDNDTLTISVRDNLRTDQHTYDVNDDDELDMEIIDKSDIEKDKHKRNMIVVDLCEVESPKHVSNFSQVPTLSLSIDVQPVKKVTKNPPRDQSIGKNRKSSLKKSSSQTLKLNQNEPKNDTKSALKYSADAEPLKMERTDTAQFADGKKRDATKAQSEQIKSNLISKRYKAPQSTPPDDSNYM